MDNKKLAKKYYRKIMHYAFYTYWFTKHLKYIFERTKEIRVDKNDIIYYLEKIIDNGNEYLLTDDYLFNIVSFHKDDYPFFESIPIHLKYLSSNEHEKMVTEMAEFIEYIVTDRYSDTPHIIVTQEDLIKKNHLNIWEKVLHERWDIMYGDYVDTDTEVECLLSILYRIAASCIVDNNYVDFDHYTNILKEHSHDILEYFKLNGLSEYTIHDYFEEVSIIDILKKYEGTKIIK